VQRIVIVDVVVVVVNTVLRCIRETDARSSARSRRTLHWSVHRYTSPVSRHWVLSKGQLTGEWSLRLIIIIIIIIIIFIVVIIRKWQILSCNGVRNVKNQQRHGVVIGFSTGNFPCQRLILCNFFRIYHMHYVQLIEFNIHIMQEPCMFTKTRYQSKLKLR